MTRHELMIFVKAMHDFFAPDVLRPGVPKLSAWPTREQLVQNLKLNSDLLGPRVVEKYNWPLRALRERGWSVEEPCMRDCHAKHVILTEEGLQMLEHWNLHGCLSSTRRDCRDDGFRFVAKAA